MRVLLLVLLLAAPAAAQQHRLIPADDVDVNAWIAQLQARGHLLALSPITRPYAEGAVRDALDRIDGPLSAPERYWVRMLRQRLGEGTVAGKDVVGGTFEGGARLTTTQRPDLMRPIGHRDFEREAGAVLPVGPYLFQTRGALDFFLERGPVFATLGLEHDLAYEDDPDGLDVQRRSYIRNEDSYLRVAPLDGLSVLVGRTTRHWGPQRGPGLLVSDNPRSYDQIGLTLGGRFLTITALAGELDAVGSDGVFDGRAGDGQPFSTPDPGKIRRFVAAHRLEYRPSARLAISLEESIVYSDPGAGFSLRYLNPLNAFVFASDNTPKNDENNLLVGGTIDWRPGLWHLTGQAMLDDFDLDGLEPTAAAFDLRAGRAAVTPTLDLRGGLTVVTRRAYSTTQPPGKYLFAQRGLATNFSDYVHLEAHADLHLMGGALRLSPGIQALWQGDGDPREPWPRNPDSGGPDVLLDSLARRTLRGAVVARYQPVAWAFAEADLGLNRSLDGTAFEGVVSFGVRLEERYWADLGLR